MANQKPKKSAKKTSSKSEKPEIKKEEVVSKPAVVQTASDEPSLKGFFARKCDKNENVITIFKTPRIWGALIGEAIGTMMLALLFLTLGVTSPIYVLLALVGVYIAIVGLSGANLNPLVTVGMMATRRMSAIRGVLYILAQVVGAWLGLIIANGFRLGSQTSIDLQTMVDIAGDSFWSVALIELLGACIIGFCFARAFKYARKSPVAFALTVTSAMVLVLTFAVVVFQNFFGATGNVFIFNPAIALMYQILPTVADGFADFATTAGLALAAYVLVPMVGGVIGFFVSDLSSKLVGKGYDCTDYDEVIVSE